MPPVKKSVIKQRTAQSLVTNRLENVSKDVFKQYYPLITELVGDSPGIYALYDSGELYYVGKSIELRKRVRQHLRDRHLASWTHFSLYLTRREEHIHEIESLLVRIANPKGNRVVPHGKSSGALLKQLKTKIQQQQKNELAKLFSTKTPTRKAPLTNGSKHPNTLVGLVDKRVPIYRTYKGKEYKAFLNPKGIITLGGVKYSSPSGAARAVLATPRAVNGWLFWYIQDLRGDWVRLADFKGA
jgi:hypothetical protein